MVSIAAAAAAPVSLERKAAIECVKTDFRMRIWYAQPSLPAFVHLVGAPTFPFACTQTHTHSHKEYWKSIPLEIGLKTCDTQMQMTAAVQEKKRKERKR